MVNVLNVMMPCTSAEYNLKIVLAHVTIEGKAVCGGVSSDARNEGNNCNTCLQ